MHTPTCLLLEFITYLDSKAYWMCSGFLVCWLFSGSVLDILNSLLPLNHGC